jgi:hypothetical protein
MNFTIRLLEQTAAVALVLSALAFTTQGQQGGLATAQAERERQMRDNIIREQLDQERELMLAMTEKLRESAQPRSPRLAIAQIREDYVRLQVINNELAEAVSRGGSLDLKLVAQSTGEIKKRADRLRLNLALPEPESETEGGARHKIAVGAEAEQVKSALGTLDGLILKFVRNPLFRNPRLVDVRQSPQVRRDLDEIIELSGQIKKRGEQLNKAAQKSQ